MSDTPLPPELIRAYREALYIVDLEGGDRVTFVVDEPPRGVAPETTLTVITAWNPGLSRPGNATNEEANARLEAVLQEKGYEYLPAVGQSRDGRHAEPSFAVVGLSVPQAKALGRQFAQAAVLYWNGSHAGLLWC